MNATDRALVDHCRRARRDDRLAVLEGLHALKHALRFGAHIQAAWTPDRDALTQLAACVAPDIVSSLDGLVEEVTDDVFAALAPQAPRTGVIAMATRPAQNAENAVQSEAHAILLENPSHLGNVGAVIRVAAAVGAAAVFTSGQHDPWDPAALRGSAGLHFALPVLRLEARPANSGPLIAIDPGGDLLKPEQLPANALLAFGSERQGLSASLLDQADQRLALPMQPGVSSLNLATAVASVLYACRLTGDRR